MQSNILSKHSQTSIIIDLDIKRNINRRCKLKPLQCYIYANNWTRGNQY